jgi:glycosyltransferase involved in cell wall biosynthesis
VVVLFSGRMIRDKGVAVLVQAAEILKARRVACSVVLCGSPDPGNPTSISPEELRRWHDAQIIRWIGYRDDMPTVLSESHVVCLPSAYGEGIPVCLLEAAAVGRALVATDAPGCREIVRHGWNGLLVPINDPNALATAIDTLVRNADLRKRMGANGRRLVAERFTDRIVHREIFAVYARLLGQRWRPAVASPANPTGNAGRS